MPPLTLYTVSLTLFIICGSLLAWSHPTPRMKTVAANGNVNIEYIRAGMGNDDGINESEIIDN